MLTLGDDLDFILGDAPGSATVLYGAQSTVAVTFVANVDLFEQARVRGVERVIVIRTGTLSGLGVGSAITVGGQGYRIAEPAFPIGGDGMMTAIPLRNG